MKQFSARQVEAINKPGVHRVDDNLYVKADQKNGKVYKSYRLRYMIDGKRLDRSLGSTTKITLKQARDKAQELMASMVAGEGVPAEQLQKAKQEKKASSRRASNAAMTFADVADEFISRVKVPGWKSALKSSQTWKNRLSTHAYSVIGNKPLADITKADIQQILSPIWLEKHETAMRVRMYIEEVFEYAIDCDYVNVANPANPRIQRLLPKYTGTVQHQPALHYSQAPTLYQQLQKRNNESARALQMVMMTAQRQIDVRSARWSDFDGDVWHAPIAKLSSKQTEYRLEVPLPAQLRELITAKKTALFNYSDMPRYVFSNGTDKYISEAAMRKELSLHGFEDIDGRSITMHGFRTTFKDWCRVNQAADDEVSEIQLSHVSRSQVRSAYARDKLLPRRAELMQRYADFLAA
ncbi:Integrase (XerC) [uncultured Mediterranean phage uvMED]|nr:Integrase (XerC) [uncultured Mediterranean phage uvMED]